MKTVKRTTSATTERGTTLTLTVTAERGWENTPTSADGWGVEVRKEVNRTNITIEANGKRFEGQFSTSVPAQLKSQGVYAIFAGKLGLSRAVYTALNSVCQEAIAEAETDENWLVLQAKKEHGTREMEEYYRNYNAVKKAMSY